MNKPAILRRLIEAGVLLGPEVFVGLDVVATLCKRDKLVFERLWLDLYTRLKAFTIPKEDLVEVDQLRERAFKTIYTHCSDPDLAGYVSDDFDVIARSLLAIPDDHFAGGLLNAYAAGVIPGEGMLLDGRPVTETLNKLAKRLI